MMINDQETQYFNSEKYGESTYLIEKTDEKKAVQEKKHDHIAVLPYWRPYDLR